MLKDAILTGNLKTITSSMYRLVNPLASLESATQLQAVVLLFHMLVDHYGLDKRKVLEVGDQIIKDAQRTDSEHYRALKLYMEKEL